MKKVPGEISDGGERDDRAGDLIRNPALAELIRIEEADVEKCPGLCRIRGWKQRDITGAGGKDSTGVQKHRETISCPGSVFHDEILNITARPCPVTEIFFSV